MSKRKADKEADAEEDQGTSKFVTESTEAFWSAPNEDGEPGKGREYILRFVDPNETEIGTSEEGWPYFSYIKTEEGEPDYTYVLATIGAVWEKSTGKFVAFWGSDEGDSHVEFYCRKDFEHHADLDGVTTALTREIARPLIDTFDDGSGGDRDVTLLEPSVFNNELLDNLYLPRD